MNFDIQDTDPQIDELDSARAQLNSKRHVKTLPLLLSQYMWLIICVAPILLGFLFPRYHPAKVYTSAPVTESWNSSKLPIVFTHATDIHVSIAEPLKIVNARLLLQSMKMYKADFNLITGDMVDNYGEKNWPKIGRQIPGDWVLWKKLVEEDAENFTIVDLAGNHDMWTIIDPLSEQNIFLDYSYTYNRSNTRTMKEFHAKTIVRNGITFVLLNQYRFPDVHPPYTYWSHPSREFLDDMEEAIDAAGPCYVVMHYPVDYNWWIRSSRGHTFEQIMQKENVQVAFSGHFHPYWPMIIHHGQGAVEYIGIGGFQMKGFGVLTVDNGRFVYNPIRLTEPPQKFIMTHPIPLEQLSSHQVFNERNTEIRVIAYVKNPVDLYVSGSVNGKMTMQQQMPNGAYLYTYPLNVPSGIHEITVSGYNCDLHRKFYFGRQYTGEKELAACYQRGLLVMKLSSVPVYLIVLWIILPFKLSAGAKTEQWIEGAASGGSHWLASILLGPTLLHRRVQELPKQIRTALLIAGLYPLFGPNHFFKPIHGHVGFSFFCFIYIAGHILYDEWAVHMTYFYVLTIIVPTIWYASSIKFLGRSRVFYFNWGFSLMWWASVQMTNYRWCGESVVIPLLFVNPTFIVIPAILHFIISRYAGFKRRHHFIPVPGDQVPSKTLKQ